MNLQKILSFSFGPIGAAALGFITLPVLTWIFSPEDIGRVAMLQVTLGLSIQLLTLGLDQSFVREFHEADNTDQLLLNTITPSLLFTIFLLIAVSIYDHTYLSKLLFDKGSLELTLIVGSCVVISVISRFLSLVLRMNEKGALFSFAQILSKLIFLLGLSFYYIVELSNSFKHLAYLHLLSLSIVLIFYLITLRRDIYRTLFSKIEKEEIYKFISYGWPLSIGGVSFWALTTMDRLFLKELASFESVGIYSVASNFAAAGIILQSIFSTIWAPVVFKWAKEGIEVSRIERVISFLTLVILFIFFSVSALSFVTEWLLPEKYIEVQFILVSCMIYPLFYTLSETTVIGLSIKRKTKYIMGAAIIALICNLVGNYFLIPLYEARGAAAATAISFWIFLILRTHLSNRIWIKMKSRGVYISSLVALIFALDFTLSITGIEVFQLRIIAMIVAMILGFRLYKESKKISSLRKI